MIAIMVILIILPVLALAGIIDGPSGDPILDCQSMKLFSGNASGVEMCFPVHFADDLMHLFSFPCPSLRRSYEYQGYSPFHRKPYIVLKGTDREFDGGELCLLESGRFMFGYCWAGMFCGNIYEDTPDLYWCNDYPLELP